MSGNRAAVAAIIVLLVISLAMNFYLITQQAVLRDRIETLSSSLQSQLGSVQGRVSSLVTSINQMEAAEEWYSRPQLDVTGPDTSCSEVESQLTWTFRELVAGADVGLRYRIGTRPWQEAAVSNEGGAVYSALLELPLENVYWMVEVSGIDRDGTAATVEEANRRSVVDVEYVIYSNADGSTRTGGTERLDIRKLGASYRVFLSQNTERRYSASVYQEGGPACMAPDGVELVALDESASEVDGIALEYEEHQGHGSWIGSVNAEEDETIQYIRIVAIVNGERFEHEVEVNR